MIALVDRQAWEGDLSLALDDHQAWEVGPWDEKTGHLQVLKDDLSTVISCHRCALSSRSNTDGHCCGLDSEMHYREH